MSFDTVQEHQRKLRVLHMLNDRFNNFMDPCAFKQKVCELTIIFRNCKIPCSGLSNCINIDFSRYLVDNQLTAMGAIYI